MSAPPKLSEWLPGTWQPTLPGVYERDYSGIRILKALVNARMFCWWSGQCWYSHSVTVEGAVDNVWIAHEQMLPWRGIAEPPR